MGRISQEIWQVEGGGFSKEGTVAVPPWPEGGKKERGRQGSSLELRTDPGLSWPDVLSSSRHVFSLLTYVQENKKQAKVLGGKVLSLCHRLISPNPR